MKHPPNWFYRIPIVLRWVLMGPRIVACLVLVVVIRTGELADKLYWRLMP